MEFFPIHCQHFDSRISLLDWIKIHSVLILKNEQKIEETHNLSWIAAIFWKEGQLPILNNKLMYDGLHSSSFPL